MKLSITQHSALVPLCEDSHKGTLHIKWDNGRGLGVVPGKDVFKIVPPEQDRHQRADPKSHTKPHLRHKTGHSGQER